jgi:hypothetical protein
VTPLLPRLYVTKGVGLRQIIGVARGVLSPSLSIGAIWAT